MAQQTPQRTSRPDWSAGLPEPEILGSIRKGLASGQDAASFRSVCKPWRAALPFKSFAPLLLLPFGPDSDRVTFYSVSDEEIISVPLPDDVRGKMPCGASRGWLALMDEAASVTLLNPFTGARVKLPPPDEHVAAACSCTRVSNVDGQWVLLPDGGNAEAGSVIELNKMRDVFFQEIVLSAPPYPGRECVAMAVLANSTQVAFCRVGVDSAWTLLDTNLECSVDCIVHCKEKIFAIDVTGDISVCNCNPGAGAPPTATLVPSLSVPENVCNRSFLESKGELHMVGDMVVTFDETMTFTCNTVVYKCDFPLDQTPVWSTVDDVGDLTLLVSKHFHESFSGASVSNYKSNSVYLSEAMYAGPTNSAICYQIIDIATNASEVVRVHRKMESSDALGWFRPNIWMGGMRLLYHKVFI
jgi:hypothetical protein